VKRLGSFAHTSLSLKFSKIAQFNGGKAAWFQAPAALSRKLKKPAGRAISSKQGTAASAPQEESRGSFSELVAGQWLLPMSSRA